MEEDRLISIPAKEADIIFNNLDAITRQGVGALACENVTVIMTLLKRANQKSLQTEKDKEKELALKSKKKK